MAEYVYTVWDLYDGVRSGIADYRGEPHFFESLFSDDDDQCIDEFKLTPIDRRTLELAQEQWAIYRVWEKRFRSGAEPLETHPGHGGVGGRFRAREEPSDLPDGCLRGRPSDRQPDGSWLV